MICRIFENGTLLNYKYSVVLSSYNGKIMLGRHRERDTWEMQGGHIEANETPLEAARRELYEESGALEFIMQPLRDYLTVTDNGNAGAAGMVFAAEIKKLGILPDFEIAEVKLFDEMPDNLTYPELTRILFDYLKNNNKN